MSFWQKLLNADQQYNEHKNQTSCVENDCSCKSNEQLLDALVKATDEDVIKGIKKVHQGGRYFSADVAEQLADILFTDNSESPFDALSEREMQVAMMVVNCKSPQQIADQLFVSVKTVNTYRYRIFEKLNIDSDVKLTHLAMRHGLVQP